MSLATMQADDAATVLAAIGESVIYHPDGGSDRSISAVIERQEESMEAEPRGPACPIRLYVANDSESGIASSELTRRDRVTLARHLGGGDVTMRITKPVGQTSGWTILDCL